MLLLNSAMLLHLINTSLQSFMFEPRCFEISFGKLENSKKTLQQVETMLKIVRYSHLFYQGHPIK